LKHNYKNHFVPIFSNLQITESRLQEDLQNLKQKLLVQAEELTELHRRKGENAQQIIELTSKLQERDKLIATKDFQ